jgi:hypothetical protein
MGGDDAWAAITEAAQPKSVLEKTAALPPTPAQTAVNLGGVSPQYVDSLQAQFNEMPAAQRNVALQQAIAANPANTVKGRAFRAIAERYAAIDKVVSPTLQKLDPRLEAVKARIAQKYPERAARYPELIEQDAQRAIAGGQLEDNYGSMTQMTQEQKEAMNAETMAKKSANAPYAEIIGANLAGGLANTVLGSAAALGTVVGATDTTNQLDAWRKSVDLFQKEHGGDTTLGKTMTTIGGLTPALVEAMATPLTGGASLIPLLSSGVLYGLPGFRDTLNEQLKSGAPIDVAVEHALASAGLMMAGGRLIATGGKVLPEALQASNKLLPQLTQAGVEGVLFSAADTATQKFIDVLNGRDTNTPALDPENMLTSALAFAATRGAHVGITHLKNKAAADARVPYVKDTSYEGLANFIAQAKGFDFREKQKLGKSEGKVNTGAEGPAMGEGKVDTGAEGPPIGEGQVDTTGKRVEPTLEETEAKPAATPANVETIAEELRANGVPSAIAQRMAEKRVAEQTQGAANVTGTEPPPSGESASVVGKPGTSEPAGGLETPARDGVVSTEPNAGVPATGEVSQPTAIEQKRNALQAEMQRLVEEHKRLDAVAQSLAFDAPKFDAVMAQKDQIFKEFEIVAAQLEALNKPTETTVTPPNEGTPASVTTPTETVETKPKKQKAPAATGRKDVHTVAQGAEGKWEHTINGEVVNSYDTKRQATAASLLAKAQKAGDADLIAQRQKAFDDAMNPNPRGKPPMLMVNGEFEKPKTETTETVEGGQELTETAEGQPAVTNIDEAIKSYRDDPDVAAGILADDLVGQTHLTAEIRRIAKTYLADGEDAGRIQFKESLQNPDSGFALLGLTQPEMDTYFKELDQYLTEKVNIFKAEPATEPKAKVPSATDALAAETQEKLQALEDMLGNYNTNPDEFSARTSAKNIARMAKDPTQPKAVRERAQQMLDEEIDSKDLSSKFTQSPADTAFGEHTNAAQAISHILRTGTKFQKALAARLRGFVQNVKFVVVEKGDALPEGLAKKGEQWDRSIAMYDRASRTIYVRGESFGNKQGINHVTVLHELLHAATARKIDLAMKAIQEGASLDSPLVQAALSLHRTMENADTALRESARQGNITEDLANLAVNGKAFSDLHEFLAYGMTDKTMQDFLIKTVGVESDTHLFNRFVDSVRRMFGMGKDSVNALSDLILATDQILSAREIGTTEETGAYSATAPDEQKQLNKSVNKALRKVATSRNGAELGDATANLAKFRDPRYLWGEIKGAWNALGYDARSRVSHFYDSEGLAYAGPGDLIPGLKDTHEAIQKMSGSVQSYLRGTANMADEVVNFYRAEPKKRQAFEDLVNATTLAGYDPSNPKNTVRNAKLDTAYMALGAEGQKVYQRLRDYYRTMNAVKQHLLEENLSKLELSDEARKKLLSDIRLLFETDKIEPYFPLARFGDFILETGKTSARATYRFDSMLERDRAAREYAAQQGKTIDELKSDGELKVSNDSNGKTLRANIEGTSKLLKSAYAAIDTASITDPHLKQNLKDNLYQAYLAAMPENSVRKMFVHRKGTPGFSSDILRAVNDSGSRMARAFAKLEHAGDIRRGVEQARRQLEGQEQYTPFVKRMEEMAAEALQPSVPTDAGKWIDSAANTIVKLSFLRNLTSWSSAIMQPMDVVMKGMPVLTGNHGPRAMVELSKMMKLHNQYGVVEKMPDGTTRFRAPSIEFATGLSPQERRAVRDMVDMYGVTKDTLANEVFSQARTPATKVNSKAFELGKDAVNTLVMGGLMHHGERLSREIIALTSFRLHLAELQKASPNNPLNYHEAVKAAVQETNEVLGNYSANNRPLMMRGAGGRLVTMYKFFPLLTTKLLLGNFFKMLPMFNKQGKAAAATKFFGVLGTHTLLGGLVALPAFSLVMGLLQAAWKQWQKDPNAPDEMRDIDYETWWRTEWLPKYFGSPELARIAEYGVLNKLTGFDISSRISLNDMWFRDPQPGKTLTDTFLNWGQVIGGAAASTALGVAQGVQLMSQGEYERGMEKLTPASISKLLIARRFAKEGIQTTQGAQLVEKGKVPTSELVGQAMGYTPARIAEAQTIAFKEQAAEKVIARERQKIMGGLKDSFRKSIDFNRPDVNERFDKIFQDTLDKAVDFSLRYPEQEIKDAEINKAINDELKKVIETEMDSGVRITKKNVILAGPSAEKAENALAPYKK